MIEVILLERIERLGHMGQTVKVRPGFARNFLLPQSKALRATKVNLDLFEKQRAELEAKNAAQRGIAEKLATKMDALKLVIIRQAGENGQLYGSVSPRDVAEVSTAAGQKLEHGQVQIDTPIKNLGLYQVKVKLHPEVSIKLTINVARSQEEALMQADKAAVAGRKAADDATGEKTATDEATAAAPEAPEGKDAAPKKKTAKKAKPAADSEAEAAAEEDAPKAKKTKAKKKTEE